MADNYRRENSVSVQIVGKCLPIIVTCLGRKWEMPSLLRTVVKAEEKVCAFIHATNFPNLASSWPWAHDAIRELLTCVDYVIHISITLKVYGGHLYCLTLHP